MTTEVEANAGEVAAETAATQATVETTATEATEATAKVEKPAAREAKSKQEVENELFETISKNASYRQRIKELEAEVKRGAELEASVADMKTAHRIEVAKARIESLAIKEGILDPVALAALDTSALKFDENGKPENLSEVLTNFKTSHPSLFASASTSSVSAVPPVQTSAATAKEMSEADFKKHWDSL